MSRRFDELEKKVEERGDDMMDLIMRTSEIQSRPKKHDKILEILEHQITDLQEKLNTCNEDKAKIEQDKLKAEALAKRMLISYDKLSKDKEKDAVLMVAKKMDRPFAKSTSNPSSADNFLSIQEGQYLKFPPSLETEIWKQLQIEKKTMYLKQRYPPGFKKLGTLIDTHTDRTGPYPTSYYYFSEDPRVAYTNMIDMFYDPIEASQRQFNKRIQPLIDAEINIGVECIKSCGLTSLMTLSPVISAQNELLSPDFKFIFNYYINYGNEFQLQNKHLLRSDIKKQLDTLTKSYISLSLENYNILIETPGNAHNTMMLQPPYPRANVVTTNALTLALNYAKFPIHGTQDTYQLGKQLGLIKSSHPTDHPDWFVTLMPAYSMFEKAQQFIKCQIDFIEKIMMIEREITGEIGEKTVKKAGVGLGLKTKRKYTKHRKSHKRKQRRQYKRTKRNNKTTKFKYPPQ